MENIKTEQEQARFTGTTTKLRSFLDKAAETDEDVDDSDDFMYKTRPIADFFADTTVMFGDIVGFTAWYVFLTLKKMACHLFLSFLTPSAGLLHGSLHRCLPCWRRSTKALMKLPSDDECSRLRLVSVACTVLAGISCCVFVRGLSHLGRSILTVGDCYVAVCGLPDARRDHALVMARFATQCLQRMKVLTGKLEKILGPDTG